MNKAGMDAFDAKEFEDPLSLWYKVLLVYTHRSITLSTDRLPAISGIATRFGEMLRDDYCAGLWKSQLARELLWTQSPYPKLKPRSLEYQGPSWSWAAVNGPITITTPSLFQVDDSFKVLDCQIRLHSQAPKSGVADKFGAVESGKMVVRGHLQRAELTRGNRVMMPEQTQVLRNRNSKGPEDILPVLMSFDALEEEFAAPDIGFIPVFLLKVGNQEAKEVEGLVLRQKNDTEYSRRGIFEFDEMYSDYQDLKTEELRDQKYQQDLVWLNDCEL